jgi:predicted glycoside hydrolase/deacetylase ChbG (UPF0249 family)
MKGPQPERRVVLCADDFAISAPVSQAIAQLAQTQRLSATSAMVLSPRWPQDADLLQSLRGQIDVGLHLDWTSEFSVAQGHGHSLAQVMLRSVLAQKMGGLQTATVAAEIERQLDAFESVWQAPPDHIDGHQHVQQFGTIRKALLQVLTRRYGPQKPYLRVSRPPPGLTDLKGRVMAAWGSAALVHEASRLRIPTAPALSGIYDLFNESLDYAALMGAWLAQVPDKTLLMCHPGLSETSDAHAYSRVAEWRHLLSDAFAVQLKERQIRLVRGSEVYT